MKELVKTAVEDIERYPSKSDNPVWDFLNTSTFIMEHYRNTEATEKLKAIKEELNGNLKAFSAFIERIAVIKFPRMRNDFGAIGQHEEEELETTSQEFFSTIRSDALRHLKITRYVPFSPGDWEVLNQADDFYRWCHFISYNMMGLTLEDKDEQRIVRDQHVLVNAISIVDRRILELEDKG